eukprot:219241_1
MNDDNNNMNIIQNECVKFRGLDIILRGSFKIVFYDKDVLSSDDIMCWCWLHSAVAAREKYTELKREDIDGAVKDKKYKHCADDFSLEFWFDVPVDTESSKEKDNVIEAQPMLNDVISNRGGSISYQSNNHLNIQNNNNYRPKPQPQMKRHQSNPNNVYNHQQQQQHQHHNRHSSDKI